MLLGKGLRLVEIKELSPCFRTKRRILSKSYVGRQTKGMLYSPRVLRIDTQRSTVSYISKQACYLHISKGHRMTRSRLLRT